MEVRRIQQHEAELYRRIRLTMLLDSPASFGESFAHAQSMPDSYWAEMAVRSAASSNNATFIAFDGAHPCGAVSGTIMTPPILTDEQTAIFSRAARGICPTPDEAGLLDSQLYGTATRLAGQQWHDPREMFDVLAQGGLGFGDIVRIVPPPRGPDGSEPPPPGGGPFGGHITCTSGMISGMWVDPTQRRKGIGHALLNAVMEWAKEQGAQRIELGVFEGNAPAIHLYEQLGFAEANSPMPPPPGPTRRFRFMERTL